MAPLTGQSGRVVVTGMGAVTPLGTGVSTFWPRLLAGESGVATITLMDASDYTSRIAAEVKDFDAADFVDKKEAGGWTGSCRLRAALLQWPLRTPVFLTTTMCGVKRAY